MRVFYSSDYAIAGHAFETTRKAAWVAESLAARPIAGVTLEAPPSLSPSQLARLHAREYVEAVRTGEPRGLAETQGFEWDPALFIAVAASSGGAVAAGRAALSDGVAGSLSSGLHHARREGGAGFCTFNGLALAAVAAVDGGAKSVLILNLDAHCGGGTDELVRSFSEIWHTDISVSSYDHYPAGPRGTLDLIRDPSKYLPALEARLAEHEKRPFNLCLYNAGMDPSERSNTGGLDGMDLATMTRREQLVFEWCRRRRLPVAFVLAGGYLGPKLDREGLVELHRLTLSAATF